MKNLTEENERGWIAWMVYNRVTPNILMIVLLAGGLFMAFQIKKEVFPSFSMDRVTVSVPFPGATPEDVEQGIILAVEESVSDITGVKEVTSTARAGSAEVSIELEENVDQQKVYADIKQQIDRITTLPPQAEEPIVSLDVRNREVLDLYLYGDVSETALRNATEMVRDRLLQHDGITQLELEGGRDFEIIIEIPQDRLRAHDLTLTDVSNKIRESAVELSAGSIDTRGGEISIKVDERKDWAWEFESIPIIQNEHAAVVTLGDIATVREGFEDSSNARLFQGQPAMGLGVFRVGDQTPIGVRQSVDEAMAEIEPDLPAGINYTIMRDRSKMYQQRLELLLRNAFLGLCLVLLVLGLFLEFRLAFWVTMGIPISFLGGMLFLPFMDVTINMISMFAFIIALGIVVDDAIVAGENIFEYLQEGMSPTRAAIKGAQDVAVPITFAIITNCLAFAPLLFVPGFIGKIWKVIPLVVGTVFVVSLVEALFILPAHLAHIKQKPKNPISRVILRWQTAFSHFIRKLIHDIYGPFLDFTLRYRTVTIAIAIGILLIAFTYVRSGRMGFILMPKIESDYAAVTVKLPPGTTEQRANEVAEILTASAQEVVDANGGDELSEGLFTRIRGDEVDMRLYLTDVDKRPISTTQTTRLWREATPEIPGVLSTRFEADRGGPGGGPSLTVELSHRDTEVLKQASQSLGERLAEFAVVNDIDDGYKAGQEQLNFTVTEKGAALGLTSDDVSRQVRAAFQWRQALKQQRGRNEVTVRVRRPESERINEFDLEQMVIKTPDGGDVALLDVATPARGRAYTSIERRDGRRTVTVSAAVTPIGETSRVKAAMDSELLPQLARDYPGLSYGYQGRQASFRDSLRALMIGMIVSMIVIYFLLAIPFRSFVQPALVMAVIPFGFVGALVGHIVMDYNLSIISIMGLVALSGVVVNDSLVMIEYTNRLRREDGLCAYDAIHQAGIRRFRPILLTTMTTFGGLAPMIFETSRQARFLIPMAISLGFGILFVTVIVLVILPSLYILLDDVSRFIKMLWTGEYQPARKATADHGDGVVAAHLYDMAHEHDADGHAVKTTG